MDKIRVMHVLCMNTYSGAEHVAITLINGLMDDVDSIYVSPDGSIRDIVQQNGIQHYAIEKVNTENIKKAIQDNKPDLIHAHDFTAGTICSFAAGSIPVINHLHNNSPWIRRMNIKSMIYGLSCFKYKKILTVSDAVMDEFIFGRFFAKKTTVVGNPIDLSTIREQAKERLDAKEFEKANTDIVFLGRLTLPKNIFFFLEIVKELKRRKKDVTVSVIGDGELRAEFEAEIARLGLGDTVRLFGFQKNPYKYLKQSKVMCMPSLWEGFGLAAVEALALGKPVVAAPVGGLTGAINDECGKLCKDKGEYVSELYRLLADPPYLAQKSEGALKRAADFDNVAQFSETIGKIYQMVAGDR